MGNHLWHACKTVSAISPIETFGDISSQIVGVLNSDITEPSDAQTIEFQVTAPNVDFTNFV